MDKKSLRVIKAEAERCYPKEACGLFIASGKKATAVPCKNIAAEPELRFLLDPNDYALAADKGKVVGVWHTHVNRSPEPSEADKAGCEASEVPWHIVAIWKTEGGFEFSEPAVLTPCGFEAPYLGRQYVFGVFDCWALARDFYRREFNIVMRDYPRIEDFWDKGFDFFGDNWEVEGFLRVSDQPQYGDIFLIQTGGGEIDHIAIYIGDEMILHHMRNRLSKRDIYGGFWKKHTRFHLRHKSKCQKN